MMLQHILCSFHDLWLWTGRISKSATQRLNIGMMQKDGNLSYIMADHLWQVATHDVHTDETCSSLKMDTMCAEALHNEYKVCN